MDRISWGPDANGVLKKSINLNDIIDVQEGFSTSVFQKKFKKREISCKTHPGKLEGKCRETCQPYACDIHCKCDTRGENRAFSVITPSKTLDLIARSVECREVWVFFLTDILIDNIQRESKAQNGAQEESYSR
mmetsp:Transcript_32363/g.63289  ORF Transcript_32363/g.63289 Transcript_32363/m.63289 type:complete len:133 (+) Transcript_32363:384-782(+)